MNIADFQAQLDQETRSFKEALQAIEAKAARFGFRVELVPLNGDTGRVREFRHAPVAPKGYHGSITTAVKAAIETLGRDFTASEIVVNGLDKKQIANAVLTLRESGFIEPIGIPQRGIQSTYRIIKPTT